MSSENSGAMAATGKTAASPKDPFLANTAYRERYLSLLHANLPEPMKGFAAFFANLNRLHTMSAMLQAHVRGAPIHILNAGSGAFAAEIFSLPFQNRQITAFDYTQDFADLYPVFRKEGLLATTEFARADANTVVYPDESFDVMVFHDIFYETALNVPDVLARFKTFLKPGGHVFLDFMNQKTSRLWRLIGKERQYRRYTVAQIRTALAESGFEILELRRSSGASSPLVILFNSVLWNVFRTSNAFAVIARKIDPAGHRT
jgi:ubiquinone/menaquinone biosynthesis C-methylase UbiE